MTQLLVTLGCSWTYGVGVGYVAGMTEEKYQEIGWKEPICDHLSFRGLLSKKYNLVNKNLSKPGSSNQWQFRLAKEFFTSDEFAQAQKKYDKIIVLWGITSTARNELYHLSEKKLVSFFLTDDSPEGRAMVNHFYDHDNEVQQLSTEMVFWNDYFSAKNVSNLWFDTFNHHDYNQPKLTNLIFANENPRDLLSKLVTTNGITAKPDKRYHTSRFHVDTDRVRQLIKCDLLGPYSHHPTRKGHQQIADMLSPCIETLL